jgi:hypothetical protein
MRGLQLPDLFGGKQPHFRVALTRALVAFFPPFVQIIRVIPGSEVPELPYYLDRSNICAAN